MVTALEIIQKMDLKPLPEEGGFYRETYRSTDHIQVGLNTSRHLNTAIYYLVSDKSFSALHRIKSDEIFHFYSGDPIEMIQITETGEYSKVIMGSDITKGHIPQVVVPKGVWQALRLAEGGIWCLMGTTVAPGFDFQDFEVGTREEMLKQFPQHRDEVLKFTRGPQEKAH